MAVFEGTGRESGVEVSIAFDHWLTYHDGLLAKLETTLPEEREERLAERG